MRWLALLLVLILYAVPAHARSGQNPTTGTGVAGPGNFGTNCSTVLTLYGDEQWQGPSASALTTVTVAATSGQIQCHLVRPSCNVINWTKLACAVVTGLAASVSECGIYTADGATRITSTGPIATAAAVTLSATGLTPYSLTGGTQYLACWASSAAATVQYRAPILPTGFNNQYANTTFNSGTGATQVAPYNPACVGASNPYTCCSGAGAGTCNGMADRVGVQGITAASVQGPVLRLAP